VDSWTRNPHLRSASLRFQWCPHSLRLRLFLFRNRIYISFIFWWLLQPITYKDIPERKWN
jgi:hypothetical protein